MPLVSMAQQGVPIGDKLILICEELLVCVQAIFGSKQMHRTSTRTHNTINTPKKTI